MATDTQAIKDRVDIVQLIGEYIPLKKAGANWKAPCPFHHEKSPSFMVHPEKQIWHCFGCGKGGDIFSFVQEMEGLDFVEALKLLAKRAGVAIDTYKSETDTSLRNRLLEINNRAAEFFHRILTDMSASKPARDYLERRQLKKETITDWQIGFIPDQWDLLTKYFTKKGFGINDLVTSGLTIRRDDADPGSGRGYYDRFRGRVMFPISDVHGNVVGFTGRVLVETEHSGGKYVNSPETPLYDKSRVLYGLHKAKTEIKARDQVVLVEGQMDVIACHQAGMRNVVAASGTALTSEQIRLIKRYTQNIAMAFDADNAGENAGKRGIAAAIAEGMNVRVIQIPTGFAKDADECIKKNQAVWFQAVENATEVMSWYFDIVTRKYAIQDPKQKRQATAVLLEQISYIPHAVERDEWVKRLASAFDIDAAIVREELKKIKNNPPAMRVASAVKQTAATPAQTVLTAVDVLAQEFWSLIVKFPELYSAYATSLENKYFDGGQFERLYDEAKAVYTTHQQLDIAQLRQKFDTPGFENRIDILILRPYRNVEDLSVVTAKSELAELWKRIQEVWHKERRKAVERLIAEADKNGDTTRSMELLKELQTLI